MRCKRIIYMWLLCVLFFGCDFHSDIKDGLSYEEYISKANQYLNNGNTEKAILAYKKALKIKPDDGKVHFALGELYNDERKKSYDLAQKKYFYDSLRNPNRSQKKDMREELKEYGFKAELQDLALEEFNAAVKYCPENWAARYHIAINHFNNRRYKEAIVEFKKVIELNPSYSNSYGLIGEAYMETGDYKAAIEYLKKNIQIDPNDEIAYYTLGKVYRKMNDGENTNKMLARLKSMKSSLYDDLRLYTFSRESK